MLQHPTEELGPAGRLRRARARGPFIPKGLKDHIGGCQNHGPLLGPPNTRCRIVIRTKRGTIFLTITHMNHGHNSFRVEYIGLI